VGAEGRVRGVDLSDDMLAMAAKRCAGQPWVSFEQGDATQLPFDDDSFDAAVSTQVYEYVADIPAALAELYRVPRSGGRSSSTPITGSTPRKRRA
jgi:ubiquinone/menaquinone biosynthesis C-methylase UbiE